MLGVRLSVKQTGCAGFVCSGYRSGRIKTIWFLKPKGASFRATDDAAFIIGTEVDYVQEGLNQLFKFHNTKPRMNAAAAKVFGV